MIYSRHIIYAYNPCDDFCGCCVNNILASYCIVSVSYIMFFHTVDLTQVYILKLMVSDVILLSVFCCSYVCFDCILCDLTEQSEHALIVVEITMFMLAKSIVISVV